jgi:alkyldihydroxyacetonephosphate synthase
MPNSYREVPVAPESLASEVLDELEGAGLRVDTSAMSRANHARDWWPRLIPEVHAGRVEQWPGCVVFAATTEDVRATLRVASRHCVPVTAQGGRSSVVGAATPLAGAITLDLTEMNRVLDIDATSGLVRTEVGILGPALETALARHDLTLGHFPQSFDLASVGGWIASRGAGQLSNRYGTIDEMVRSLTVVLANGDVVHVGSHGPREACGPDLSRLFLGSEGTLGVITEATLRARRRATYEERRAFSFGSFEHGLDACRRVIQRGARPAVLRLYDGVESKRNFELEDCALIVLDEGDEALVRATLSIVDEECSTALARDHSLVAHWLERRNDVSALGPLWERGFVVDTIEVAGFWSILPELHRRVLDVLGALEGAQVASVHQSHAYDDGACLYFTFAGQSSDPQEFYRRAWDAAMDVVMDLGAAISHHHGVGRNRARFVPRALGDSYSVLRDLKEMLDPTGIMNPGVLGLAGDAW